jgi:hypothetical protein
MMVRSGGLPSSPAPAGRCMLPPSVFRKAKKRDPRTKLPRGGRNGVKNDFAPLTIMDRQSYACGRASRDCWTLQRPCLCRTDAACRPYACGGASRGCRTLRRRRRRRDTRRVVLPYVLESARCLCSGMGMPCRKLCTCARAAHALRVARLVCPARGWPSCSDARALRHVHCSGVPVWGSSGRSRVGGRGSARSRRCLSHLSLTRFRDELLLA